jgi:hypothetical protein
MELQRALPGVTAENTLPIKPLSHCAACGAASLDVPEYTGQPVFCSNCEDSVECIDCHKWANNIEELDNVGCVCDRCRDNWSECEDCSVWSKDNYDVGHTVCNDCYENYCDCADCNEWFVRDDMHAVGRDYVCESCWEEYTVCNDCNNAVKLDDCENIDDNCVCERCARNYNKCCCCSKYVEGNEHVEHNGEDYCSECFNDRYFCCDGCNDYYCNDEQYCTDDSTYCSECYRQHNDEDIDGKAFRPTDNTFNRLPDRQYGVELETCICDGFSELDGQTVFSSCDDGSINGKEFVSTVLRGDAGLTEIEKFCTRANRLDFQTDRACGFHLHVDVTEGLTEDNRTAILLGYFLTENFWFACVDEARTENSFCVALSAKFKEADIRAQGFGLSSGRYLFANFTAFRKHGTLEIRLHQATLDAQAITQWAIANVRFVDAVSKMTTQQVSERFGLGRSNALAALKEILGADCYAYYAKRLETVCPASNAA